MKKQILILVLIIATAFSSTLQSQTSQLQTGFKWQGLAKDAAGNPVTQPITLTFTILQNNDTVYVENHAPITPNEGQVTATVGMGTPTQGTLAGIDWSAGICSLNVKMKVGSGTVVDMGTSEIVLPPFLLSSLADDGRFVGIIDLMSNGEGIFSVNGGNTSENQWTISTKTFSGGFEDVFSAIPPVPGTVREFYIGLVVDANTDSDDCLYDNIITLSELPQNAQNWIAAIYFGLAIQKVTINNSGNYAVLLSDGTALRFNSNGSFDDECGGGGGPECLYDNLGTMADLPQNAQNYIATNYPALTIQAVTVKNNGRSAVLLSDGTILQFHQNGNFQNECNSGGPGGGGQGGGNTGTCASNLNIRFYFPGTQALGHQDTIPFSWVEDISGQTKWLKVPSPAIQIPNSMNLSWRLEVGLPQDCAGKGITIKNIVLTAIDKANGSQPTVIISGSIGAVVTPIYKIGGLDGKILIDEDNNKVIVSGDFQASQVQATQVICQGVTSSGVINANGGITSQGVINANGGINIPGISIVNGNLGIGTTTPNEKLEVNGRTKTKVLEITGGSDLAENFDITSPQPEPGLLVSIDPDHPGQLKISSEAYDRKVAGIISGAGGIAPGMVMGQEESIANGKYPVAMVGRVYVHADASFGKIEPGDMLTTSPKAGVAMKVSDFSLAHGAIIGKAMTSLTEGQGLVLVLVNLQ